MVSEPRLHCPDGHGICSLADGAACGMRCVVCGQTLAPCRSRWLDSGQPDGAVGVSEVVLPAHNPVDAASVAQFLAGLPLPVSLELAGAGDRRSLLVRGTDPVRRQVAGMLQARWPAASLRPLSDDPLAGGAAGEAYPFRLELARPDYFPLRTWESFADGDPLDALLAAVLGLAADERLGLRLHLLGRGTPAWLDRVQQRLKLETQRGYTVPEQSDRAHQLPVTPAAHGAAWQSGLGFVLVLGLAAAVVGLGLTSHAVAAGLLLLAGMGGAVLWQRLQRSPDRWHGADLALIRDKVIRQERWLQVRIEGVVWAAGPQRARALAAQMEQAVAQYAVSGGNRLELVADEEARSPAMWLSPVELAGLWHPPLVSEHLSPGLLPLDGTARRAPDPRDVAGFYPIGTYRTADGTERPVHISTTALKHNLFCIGKPGTGKSTLMLHLCLAALADPEGPALLVVDPHGDLAQQLIGALPEGIEDRVRILDVGDPDYCFPFNPLDVHRDGWDVRAVTHSIVDIGRALWSDYWGPRMQIPLTRGVQLLAAANARRPADACLGLSQLASLLNADPELRQAFLATELTDSPHLEPLARYFRREYDSLNHYFRQQIIQPVLSKAYRFEEEPMLTLFSCPSSRLDLQQVFRERQVLVITTGKNRYGAEISDFIGSLLINVALMELVRQGERRPAARWPVALVVDEFQTFAGVDWAELLQQMRKYGGRLVLGTQSLSSLRQQDTAVPEIILSGVYSLFAFTMNGEDARYLARHELSQERGGPDPDTLISLAPFQAYVRLEREDGRMARPFWFHSRPPPPDDALRAAQIRRRRARYSLTASEAAAQARAMLAGIQRYGQLGGEAPPDAQPDPVAAGAAGVLLAVSAADADEPDAASGPAVAMPWGEAREPTPDPAAGPLLSPSEWSSFLEAWDAPGPAQGGGMDDTQPGG